MGLFDKGSSSKRLTVQDILANQKARRVATSDAMATLSSQDVRDPGISYALSKFGSGFGSGLAKSIFGESDDLVAAREYEAQEKAQQAKGEQQLASAYAPLNPENPTPAELGLQSAVAGRDPNLVKQFIATINAERAAAKQAVVTARKTAIAEERANRKRVKSPSVNQAVFEKGLEARGLDVGDISNEDYQKIGNTMSNLQYDGWSDADIEQAIDGSLEYEGGFWGFNQDRVFNWKEPTADSTATPTPTTPTTPTTAAPVGNLNKLVF